MVLPGAEIPAGTDQATLTLRGIDVEGVTAFPKEEIEALYRQYLGQRVTLATVWHIADLITARYQKAGFFLAGFSCRRRQSRTAGWSSASSKAMSARWSSTTRRRKTRWWRLTEQITASGR